MPSCFIIACDNGFGHTRRTFLIANALGNKGWDVDLFANNKASKKFARLFGKNDNVKLRHFLTNTDASVYKKGKADGWLSRLPNLERYDVVLSDNLPEILRLREDAILSGSFLWHRAVEDVDYQLYNNTETLLKEIKPLMIASELFVKPELAKVTNLQTVGLCVPSSTGEENLSAGKNLLIACGRSGAYENEFRKLIHYLMSSDNFKPFEKVYVDPTIMPENCPKWVVNAPFDNKMYESLRVAICRPGVGTLTDCLWNGVRIYCNFEKGNKEMDRNARIIKDLGVGDYFPDTILSYKAALTFVKNKKFQDEHFRSIKQVNFDGVLQSTQYIENHNK